MTELENTPAIPDYQLNVDCGLALSFVLQQNSVPFIRHIQLQSSVPVQHSRVVVRTNPQCIKELSLQIGNIDAHQPLTLNNPKLVFDIAFLQELHENIKANLEFIWLDEQGQVLAEQILEIDVLSIDTWGGERQPIELLASFSLPNASVLSPILVKASEWLKQHQHGALDGYLSKDKQAVIYQLQALWAALLEQNIHYVVSPASFVQSGQRVRLPKRIFQDQCGCCLDTTLLLTALIEHIGLDPLIIVEEGHAYVGVWLSETPMVDLILDDVQVLRKRYELGEVFFLESTVLTQNGGFVRAENTALSHITAPSGMQKFYFAIDVRQARLRGIRPLSVRTEHNNFIDEQEMSWNAASLPGYGTIAADVEQSVTRVDRWLRRLLDLSLRNKLLNFKDNRYSIPLHCSSRSLATLEDELSNQSGFYFRSVDSISLKEVQRDNEERHIQQYVEDSFARKLLFSPLDTQTLDKRLVEVFRASRTALEEGGANTLFLAIGFLEWKESPRSSRVFKAPLLLIPVRLTRETAKTGYRLFAYDDEPRFNDTLLQLLRQDFELDIKGLNPLPSDESGVDVNLVLHLVRQAIVNMQGWEVKAEAAIGQFSFSKYLMWLDLSSRVEQLKAQPVVNHLIETPREPFIKQDAFPQPAQLDQQYKPEQLFTPLSSDSSQLAAVMSAALGRTFVLSGPPGTGKSQTITNMIAQCLADGKSVLFVSEKMAALDVVYRRLSQIGLSALCLQLHSSKAQKTEVLDQLRERTQQRNDPYFINSHSQQTEWQNLSDKLIQSRDELNQHVRVLHEVYPIGWSLYAAMSDELRYRDTPVFRFPDISMSALTYEQREQLNQLVIKAAGYRQLIDEKTLTGLNGFAEGITEAIWTLVWQEQYLLLQDRIAAQVQALQQSLVSWQQAFQWPEQHCWNALRQDAGLLHNISQLIARTDLALLALVKDMDATAIHSTRQIVEELKQQRANLAGQYQPDIYQTDLRQISFKWREAEAKIWPFSWLSKFQLRNLIRTYQTQPQRPTALAVAHDLPILQNIQNLQQRFADAEKQFAQSLQQFWKGEDTDWQELEQGKQHWQTIQQLLAARPLEPQRLLSAFAFVQSNSLQTVQSNLQQLEQSLQQLLPDQVLLPAGKSYAEVDFKDLLARQQQLQQHSTLWRHWLNWQAVKQQLSDAGLKPLADELQHTVLSNEQTQQYLNINLMRHWISHQFSQYPELNQFNSQQHEQKIQHFTQQDRVHQRAASQEIIVRWNDIFKDQEQYKAQWALLNKELGKKRRHIPVRELMRQIPDVLLGLKPCLLMSPLSIAQYLDTAAKFDVVIFDEASQIPVWDAIGALARGKQSIVVGDNKQMPPTSFFGKGDAEEAIEEDVTEDLESILDECLAAQLPELALNWHYRSRYESLIQFSNQKYYKGGLFTFPAPVAKDTAVKLHMVEGVYDKGDTRTNLIEAREIVAFIIQHLQSQLGQGNPLSLGVVTFNMTQQKLIEDLLDNELVKHPELEVLSKSGIEPVFIKNLENVQGDERDIIVFSITYAKDQQGRLSMNFGALNRQGGQRRLNVAITRARQGLHVFSALHPEEINLARTGSEGVRDLKDFLLYARHGQLHLGYSEQQKQPAKKELIEYLRDKLSAQGWQVDVAVGCGDSCVDLALRDAQNAGRYIAGILVDGEGYANAATARDRDQLRPSVLDGLGWQLLSVWTVDWWLEPEQNLQKLIARLDLLTQPEGTVK